MGGGPLQTQGHGQWERRQAHSRGERGSQIQNRKVTGTFQDDTEDGEALSIADDGQRVLCTQRKSLGVGPGGGTSRASQGWHCGRCIVTTVMQGLVGSILTAPRQARGLCMWRETGGQELGEPPSIELRVLGKWGKWAVGSL